MFKSDQHRRTSSHYRAIQLLLPNGPKLGWTVLGLAVLGIGIAALTFLLRSDEIGLTLLSPWLIPLHLLLVLIFVLEVQEAWSLWRWSQELNEVGDGTGRRAVEICVNVARESIGASTSETRLAIETISRSLIGHLGVRFGRYAALGFAALGLIMGVYFLQMAFAQAESRPDHFDLFLGMGVIYSGATVLFAILLSYWGRSLVLNWSYLACGLTQLPYDFDSIQPELSSFSGGEDSIIQADANSDSGEESPEDVNWDDVGGSSTLGKDDASEELESVSSLQMQRSDEFTDYDDGEMTDEDEDSRSSETHECRPDPTGIQSADESSKKASYTFDTVDEDIEDEDDELDI